MGCEAGQCKTSTPQGIFIVTPSLEGLPTNEEAPSPLEVRLALLDTNPVFQCLLTSLNIEGGLLVIVIDCMLFLSPVLDVARMSMSTVSFLAQLDSAILCL